MAVLNVNVGGETGFTSESEAIAALVTILISLMVTLIVLCSAVYHHFVAHSIRSPRRRVTVTFLLSLTFNVLFCTQTFIVVRNNVMSDKVFSCLTSSSMIPLLLLARLSLYYFFLARCATIMCYLFFIRYCHNFALHSKY